MRPPAGCGAGLTPAPMDWRCCCRATMLSVFESIFPVILITALGYLVASRRLLSAGEIDGLSRFVFSLALPFLLFDSLVNAVWPESFHWTFFFAF